MIELYLYRSASDDHYISRMETCFILKKSLISVCVTENNYSSMLERDFRIIFAKRRTDQKSIKIIRRQSVDLIYD